MTIYHPIREDNDINSTYTESSNQIKFNNVVQKINCFGIEKNLEEQLVELGFECIGNIDGYSKYKYTVCENNIIIKILDKYVNIFYNTEYIGYTTINDIPDNVVNNIIKIIDNYVENIIATRKENIDNKESKLDKFLKFSNRAIDLLLKEYIRLSFYLCIYFLLKN